MINTYVVSRLNMWALWRLRRDDGGLGYPRKSAFTTEPGGSFWTPEMDSASTEMDACVCALRDQLKQVIMLEFTRAGTQEQKAKLCSCHVNTYKNRLNAAYNELLGYLNDQAAGVALPVNIKPVEKVLEIA